jgi:hypothetical protein
VKVTRLINIHCNLNIIGVGACLDRFVVYAVPTALTIHLTVYRAHEAVKIASKIKLQKK